MATGPTVEQSAATAKAVPADRGRLFIYRPYNYIGSAASPVMTIDQSLAGVLMLEGVLSCDLEPGNHVVSGAQYVSNPAPVALVGGQAAYLRVEPDLIAGFSLLPVAPKDGAAEVASMHLIATTCPQEATPVARAALEAPPPAKPDIDAELASGAAAEERGDLIAALAVYTTTLQKHVTRLRDVGDIVDRAIDVALRMTPPPTIPDGARRHADAAVAAIKAATSKTGFAVARRDYQDALAAAPWWADGWLNLSLVDAQVGTTADVRQDLVWYLRAAPDAADRDAIQRKIDDLGARR
jgi:hypothetical protein